MIRPFRFFAYNLAFGYVALSIAVLVLFAAPLGIVWHNGIDEARTARLEQDVQRLTDIFNARGTPGLVAAIESHLGSPFSADRVTLFADPALAKLAGNLSAWPAGIDGGSGTHELSIGQDGASMQVIVIHATLPGGYQLLVGREISRFNRLERLFWHGLAAAAVAVVVLGLLAGALIRRALLSELHSIRRTASAIVAGDLSRRLPTQNAGGELDLLAQTLNRMLEQIEHLVHGVRNVSNAIAHDLRTPLAELRSDLEELSLTRPAPEATFAAIETAVADVDRVINIFNALLRLAEIDTGARRAGFVQVNVADVAGDAAEFYRPLAELNGINLKFGASGNSAVAGDPLLLAQAIGNLIDNALKFAQKNGRICVEVTPSRDSGVAISVTDDGPGICDDEKPKVTERFYRGDASRGTPGVGLGLSLVAAVAKLHGGCLELADNNPGLRATLVLLRTG